MKRCWRSWVALLCRREAATTLALFRIAVAAVMLFSVLSVVSADLVEALWLPAEHGGIRRQVSGFWPLELLGGAAPTRVWALVFASIGLSALMAVGFGGRATIFIALYAYRTLSTIGHGSGSYDLMIFNACWLLVLARSTETLSLDCRLRRGRWTSEVRISAWPRYLVIGQLALVYTVTGLHKLSASWTFLGGYSALYWVMQDPKWVRFDADWTASAYPLMQILTATVWHFEVSAGIVLLIFYYRATAERPGRLRSLFNRRDLRRYWAGVGISMHLGIMLLMNLGPFSLISMAYYLCLWRPAELEAALGRARACAPALGRARPITTSG